MPNSLAIPATPDDANNERVIVDLFEGLPPQQAMDLRLEVAIYQDDVGTVADLLSEGAIPSEKLLGEAARRGTAACVRLLLPHCDARAPDDSGLTAIEHATALGHAACADLLAADSDPLHAEAALKKFGPLAMPRFFAPKEAAELRAELNTKNPAQQAPLAERAAASARRL